MKLRLKAKLRLEKNMPPAPHKNTSPPTILKWCHNLSKLFQVKFNIFMMTLNSTFLTFKNVMAPIKTVSPTSEKNIHSSNTSTAYFKVFTR